MSAKNQWIPARPSVEMRWEDCTIGFRCSCGVDLQLDSLGDETIVCDCGRRYRLVVHFQMTMAEPDQ